MSLGLDCFSCTEATAREAERPGATSEHEWDITLVLGYFNSSTTQGFLIKSHGPFSDIAKRESNPVPEVG